MNIKERFIFRGFHEDPQGEKVIYIEGRAIKGQWLYGNLKLITSDGGGFIAYIRSYGRTGHSWRVIPETVGLFSGMRARGERIFEGDVCRFYGDDGRGEDFIIRWNEKLSRYEAVWQENDAADDLDTFFAERAEVIGTVFDRKEEYDRIF